MRDGTADWATVCHSQLSVPDTLAIELERRKRPVIFPLVVRASLFLRRFIPISPSCYGFSCKTNWYDQQVNEIASVVEARKVVTSTTVDTFGVTGEGQFGAY